MFQRILVPLDGSQLAETVLPAAVAFAELFRAKLILFHVIEKGVGSSVHGERHLQIAGEAQAYLDEVAVRFVQPGLQIENHVHTEAAEEVSNSIIRHVQEFQIDLVACCAHGSGDLRDRLIGSIAQQVIQRGNTPVLFVRPEMDFQMVQLPPKGILAPLDGDGQHEDALVAAMEIAKACGAKIELVTVVPTSATLRAEQTSTGMLMPITTSALLELTQRGAVEYLQEKAGQLYAQGVQVHGLVARGDVAGEILKLAEHADLVIMATHGPTNWDAFWKESVTPRVMGRTRIPMLLVRKL
jgi:nucleotide-binding universal stress UspA family protein